MALQTRVEKIIKPALVSTPGKNGLLQRKCSRCNTDDVDNEHEDDQKKHLVLQRRAASEGDLTGVPPIVHDVLRSSGEPLDSETRAFMEPRLGHDFSKVRIHTDEKAAESARAVNALAYTVGQDIVFEHGHYEPSTHEGRRLLAHELTHTIQQTSMITHTGGILEISRPDVQTEKEAEKVSRDAMSGRHAILETKDAVRIARQSNVETPDSGTVADIPDAGASISETSNAAVTDAGSPLVRIISADVTVDQITVELNPAGLSGDLTLQLIGTGGNSHTIRTVARPTGTHNESFDTPHLALGEYTSIKAIWNVQGRNYVGSYMYHIKVLGNYRHSQYNIPHENNCGGSPVPAYITNASCIFTPTTLRERFVSQVNLNGSGVSISHGNLQREAYWLRKSCAPVDSADRSFRQGAIFQGTCGSLNNTTVARLPTHPDLGCGDRIYIHTQGTKAVTDECPGCEVRQLDNFTTSGECAGIPDLGRFMTIKLF